MPLLPSKTLDPQRLIESLPDLDGVQAVGGPGPLEGFPFTLSRSGEFRVSGSPHRHRLHDFSRDHIAVSSEIGEVVLERPLITRVDFDGTITGHAISMHLVRDPNAAGAKVQRMFIRTDDALLSRVCFPRQLLFQHGGAATAYLPLAVAGTAIEVFYVKEGPFLIVEASADIEAKRYQAIVGATRLLLTYLTGERFDTDSCEVIAVATSDLVIEARWYQGRSIKGHIYHPIPMSWTEIVAAHRALKLPGHPMSALDPALISACLEYLISNPAVGTALEYLVRFAEVPVEMRGAFLAVALESFTDHLVKAGLLAEVHLLPEQTWNTVRSQLLNAADLACVGCKPDQRKILRDRINGLNRPTNNQKLMQPFETVGVTLTGEQKEAIDSRNKLLHQGRLLNPEVTSADPTAWRQAYAVEMHLYTAINSLILKRLGYRGALIDWGETSIDSGEQNYVTI